MATSILVVSDAEPAAEMLVRAPTMPEGSRSRYCRHTAAATPKVI
jgi:hypothetical protein